MASRLTLGIDYSNICYRSMYVIKYAGANITDFGDDRQRGELARKIAMDTASLVKLFRPNDVCLFVDSRDPWRDGICKDYKGTRKRDDTIDMESVHKVVYGLLDTFKAKGFRVMKVDHAEADDLAGMYVSNRLPGESVLLVSTDADWLQLASFDARSGEFVSVLNPVAGSKGVKTLSGTADFVVWMNTKNLSRDIFNMEMYTPKDRLHDAMVNDNRVRLVDVDPSEVLINKIMCGDDGDNVPSMYEFWRSGKKVRVTPKKAELIRDYCGADTSSDLVRAAGDGSLKTAVEKAFKITVDDCDFNDRISEQRKRVELDPSLFPEDIVNGFGILLEDARTSDVRLEKSTMSMESLLEGTKYLDNHVKGRQTKYSDVFRDFIKNGGDGIENNLF